MSSLQGRRCRQMAEMQESVYMHSIECFWQSVSARVASKGVDEWELKESLFMERKWKGLASIQARKVTQISHTRMYTWMSMSKKTEKKVLALWPDFSFQLVHIYSFWRGFWSWKRLLFNACPRCWLVTVSDGHTESPALVTQHPNLCRLLAWPSSLNKQACNMRFTCDPHSE